MSPTTTEQTFTATLTYDELDVLYNAIGESYDRLEQRAVFSVSVADISLKVKLLMLRLKLLELKQAF